MRTAMCLAAAVLAAVCIARPMLRGDTQPAASEQDAVAISAAMSQEWDDGPVHVSLMHGDCRIEQGDTVLRARKMVLFRRTESTAWDKRDRLTVYLEDDVRVDRPGRSVTRPVMVVHLVTRAGVAQQTRSRVQSAASLADDPLYRRAEKRVSHGQRRTVEAVSARGTQSAVSAIDPTDPAFDPYRTGQSVQIQSPPGRLRRVRISPRSTVPLTIDTFPSTATTPPEQIVILKGGVRILIDGVGEFGTVDLSADRMVIWRQDTGSEGLDSDTIQTRDTPFQVYMEGNIVIRQGGNPLALPDPRSSPDAPSFIEQQRSGQLGEVVLRGTHAVYDAREERALLLNAELKTFVPRINGNLRIRADRIRQRARNSFHAQRAWVSGSQFAKPGYRIQSSDIFFEPRIVNPWVGPSGGVDPLTGQPIVTEVPWVTSLNNTFLVGDVPLFYTPFAAAPVDDLSLPLRRVSVGQDRTFGAQVETVWNMFTLLGMEEPAGVRWDLYADYFSKRGPAVGTGADYTGEGLLGLPGLYKGEGLIYGIHDTGRDRLGRGRNSLIPKSESRGRVFLRHRHDLPANSWLTAEIGLLSDRNFLEQYYEAEFDRKKDNETLLYFKQHFDNLAWSALGRPQVNDFANTTQWLPRGDLFLFSEPLLNGLVTWSSHTSAGYGNLEPASAPTDPQDLYDPAGLPYIVDASGAVLMSRHELRMPFNVGPVNVVPYVMGEGALWGDGGDGDSIDRFVGTAGVRSSLMFWRTYPFVSSRVFNLNGLAHKMRLEAAYALTESTRDLDEIAQYNEFDDNAQERFRGRLIDNTFGGTVPATFDPRMYAVRTGAGSGVMAPYHELMDDQQVVRLALRQRLQTKVGPPDMLRIKDWMLLDLEASFFPNPDRDNFGEDVGLLGGDYRWNFSDRTSLEASAYYDLFDDAQQLWSVGLLSRRTERGRIYAGVRQVKGASLDSRIATFAYSYVMGPKWVSSFTTSYDLAEQRNNGQRMIVTRVGADFLVHLGVNYDESKDNFGVALSVEPKFGLFKAGKPGQFGSLFNSNDEAP